MSNIESKIKDFFLSDYNSRSRFACEILRKGNSCDFYDLLEIYPENHLKELVNLMFRRNKTQNIDDVLKKIIEKGNKHLLINVFNCAGRSGSIELVKKIIQENCLSFDEIQRCCEISTHNGHFDLVEYFTKNFSIDNELIVKNVFAMKCNFNLPNNICRDEVSYKIMKYLVEEKRYNGYSSVLRNACMYSHEKYINFALSLPLSKQEIISAGFTAIHFDKNFIFNKLVERGATDFNKYLIYAVNSNRTRIAEKLISLGATNTQEAFDVYKKNARFNRGRYVMGNILSQALKKLEQTRISA